jgi:hypothetical protein
VNWTAIAAIAELVGAFGVIMSLVYLGYQIKQGAAATKWSGAHDVMTNINDLLLTLAGDGEVAKIWTRGLVNFDELNPEEKVRFSSLMLGLVNSWDEAYHALAAGQIDEWGLQRFTGSLNDFAVMPGFKSWFEVRKRWMSADIRSRLEQVMAQQDANSDFYALIADPSQAPGRDKRSTDRQR